MKLRNLLILNVSLALMGCASSTPQPVISPPFNAMMRCIDAPLLRTDADYGDVLKYTVNVLHQHNTCAVRHDALIAWIEQQQGESK